MKKPSMSKQSIGNFFLHHTEKLILALCIALFGVFFWMGLNSKPFDGATPSDLVSMSDRASAYVKNPTVWDAIQPHRKGNTDVLGDIEKFEGDGKLKSSAYMIDTLTGIPAKTLDARMDPILVKPQDLHARQITAPLLIAMQQKIVDVYSGLTPVSSSELNPGFGGSLDGGFGKEDMAEMEEAMEDQGFGSDPGFGREEEAEAGVIPNVDAGAQVQTVHAHTMPGIIPAVHGIGADRNQAFLTDLVCVTAVLDVKKQFESFDGFAGSIGYFPDRDRPSYQHVEVQRRVKGGKWQDRSEWVQFKLPAKYPMMHNMPMSFHSTAPDNTSPLHYDPVLTGPNPPIAMFNYLDIIGHPKLAGMTRQFPEREKEEALEAVGVDSVLNENQEEAVHGESPFGNRQVPGRGIPGRGGLGGPTGHELGARGHGSAMASKEFNQTRAGGDFSDYTEAMQAKRPEEQFKLVRFFDTGVKQNTTYEYRMRVWMADPNNEDLTREFISYQQSSGGDGPQSYGVGEDGHDEVGDMLGRPPTGPGGVSVAIEGEDRQPVFQWQEITSGMKNILVRRRLKKATAELDPKTRTTKYQVAELRTKKTKGADGKEVIKEEYEMIDVPINRPYLRHARPSEWSESVEIKVTRDNSQVAVGRVLPPKVVRMKVNGVDALFPAGEPESEIVASVWSAKYGTAIPTKQKVSRGELLNFHTAAHIVNPITWDVYLTKNDSEVAQGEDKYKVPINTGKVVVDAIVGDELPLPRAEKMRHNLPSEILVMDAAGNFKISNDMDDRTTYRNLLLEPDESQTVGRPRRPKKKKDPSGEEDFPGF